MYSTEENIKLVIIDNMSSSEPVVEPVAEMAIENVVEEPVAEMAIENVVEEPVAEMAIESLDESEQSNDVIEEELQTAEEYEIENISKEIYPDYSEVYGETELINTPIETEENPLYKSLKMTTDKPVKIPKLIFVVPYRDRLEQYQFFDDHMRTRILTVYEKDDYLILYAHQTDNRSFNRGAMKNIGFLAGKAMFPNDYQNITFVFNDVDTMPYVKNFLNYETWPGNVKHFYGYHFALGGIVSITGGDFERTNGYPNLFSWSCEDNCLQRRVLEAGLNIDRSQFYPIMDKHILQNKDGLHKIINRVEHDRVFYGSKEGISNLLSSGELKYDYDEATGFVNVRTFSTGFEYFTASDKIHNIADGTKLWQDSKIGGRNRRPGMFSMRFNK